MIQLPLAAQARIPGGTLLFLEIGQEFAIREGGEEGDTPRTCFLTTRIGEWHIEASAEHVLGLLAVAMGLSGTVRYERLDAKTGEGTIRHRRLVKTEAGGVVLEKTDDGEADSAPDTTEALRSGN